MLTNGTFSSLSTFSTFKKGGAKDGVAKDGVAKDGVAKDGVAKDGLAKDGVAKDGGAKDFVFLDFFPIIKYLWLVYLYYNLLCLFIPSTLSFFSST
jgi:pentapeptide MXKDX repeat protein